MLSPRASFSGPKRDPNGLRIATSTQNLPGKPLESLLERSWRRPGPKKSGPERLLAGPRAIPRQISGPGRGGVRRGGTSGLWIWGVPYSFPGRKTQEIQHRRIFNIRNQEIQYSSEGPSHACARQRAVADYLLSYHSGITLVRRSAFPEATEL